MPKAKEIKKDLNNTCDDCDTSFLSSSLLKKHQDSSCGKSKNFQCEFCDSYFMSKYSLAVHRKNKHIEAGVKQFKCNYCDKKFVSKGQVKVHERCHTKEKAYHCGICNKGFAHRESLVTHSTLHTGLKVSFCIYWKLISILIELIRTFLQPYQCQHCQQTFSCIGNLIKHRKIRPDTCGLPKYTNQKIRHRAGVKLLDSGTQIVLRDPDPTIEGLDTPGIQVINEFSAVGEQYQDDEMVEQIENIEESSQDYMTDENAYQDEQVEEYQIQVKDEEDMETEDFKIEFLDEEGFIVEDQEETGVNYGFEEIIEEVQVADDEVPEEVAFDDVQDNLYEDYADEQEEVYDEYEEQQPDETENVELNDELSSHIEQTKDQFLCRYCPKQYQKLRPALNHLRIDHAIITEEEQVLLFERSRPQRTETVFTCDICSKSFAYKNLLRSHRALHGDEGEMVFKCNCCSLHFDTMRSMHTHLYEEHLDELKCTHDGCDKIFDYPIKLKKHIKFAHMRIANADSKANIKKLDFVCEICGKLLTMRFILIEFILLTSFSHRQSIQIKVRIQRSHQKQLRTRSNLSVRSV